MFLLHTAAISVVVGVALSLELSFPAGFKFGVASASYQVEGAWNVSDKGEGIWDRYAHRHPSPIADRSTGDVACDSYHLWREDVQMIRDIGAHFYRFSISWPRLLPSGLADKVSSAGAQYYSQLIDALLENNIQPVVTLYHWDLPQSLQDLGGWSNPLIVEWFADYARVVYSLYADRVRTWITINEPMAMCDVALNTGGMAPGLRDPERATFLCNKHVLLAHARAYRIYHQEFKHKQNGGVSLANNFIWIEASSPEHEDLAELAMQNLGRYSHPVYSAAGGWPPRVEEAYAQLAREQGARRSMLPSFTPQEIRLIRGSYDFFALNHYTSRLLRAAQEGESLSAWPLGDLPHFRAKLDPAPSWPGTPSSWFFVFPEGLRRQLAWLRREYGDIPVLITENGFPTRGGLQDDDRIQFYKDYLTQLLLSIHEDGVNVTGYTAWTLMDNFEWMDGYMSQFGLYQVDFTSDARTRTPRSSAHYYAAVIRRHSLDLDLEHTTHNVTDTYA